MKLSPKRTFALFTVLWIVFVAAAGCEQQNEPLPVRPNIILIVADDLGYGGLSSFGEPGYETVSIDRLAREGLRFTDFYANAPVCTPTRAALMTGRYPQRSGLEGVIYVQGATRQVGLSQAETTVAELLKTAGYRTAVIGKWHLGFLERFSPIHQGFDEFTGFLSGNIDYHSHVDNAGIFDWWHSADLLRESGYATDLITQHSVDFIEENKGRPFFLYVSHAAPHVPFQGREDPAYRFEDNEFTYFGPVEDRHRAYADMMTALDQSVGRIVARVEKAGIAERTLVLFTSDNGGIAEYGNNKPLRGNKSSLWDGGIRVPGIAWWPGSIQSGVSDYPAMTMDLFPTLLGLARIDKPDNLQLDGMDLSPLLLDGAELDQRKLFWRYRSQRAVRDGAWKLVLSGSDTLLFNLDKDIAESTDLSVRHGDRVMHLRSAVEEWERDVTRGVVLKTD